MIPSSGFEWLVDGGGLVGIVADLKYVVVYLHIAEAHAALSLYSHYRTDIRIFGLERIHIYPGLEGQLPECGEGAVQLERRHFVNVARSQIYGLADCRAVLPEGGIIGIIPENRRLHVGILDQYPFGRMRYRDRGSCQEGT